MCHECYHHKTLVRSRRCVAQLIGNVMRLLRDSQSEYGGQHHESGHCPNAAIGMDHPPPSREYWCDRIHRVDHSDYDTGLSGLGHLTYLAEHRTWWMVLQGLVLGANALLIPTFMALYPTLAPLDRSNTAIGVVLAISCMVLFIAYFPPVNGLVYLSDQYSMSPPRHQRLRRHWPVGQRL